MTQDLGIFLPDRAHVVDQELEVGINWSHFCVYGATGIMDLLRDPLFSVLEVDGNIVHFNLIVLLPLPSLSVLLLRKVKPHGPKGLRHQVTQKLGHLSPI